MADNETNQQVTDQTSQTGETPEQTYARLYGTAQATSTQQVSPVVPAAVDTAFQQQLVEALQSMGQELASIKANQPAPVVPPVVKQAWVDKIREGDYAGAEQVLIEQTKRAMAGDLEAVRTKAYQDAMAASQVNIEMERHLNSVRATNPDVVRFERYIEPLVAGRVEAAKSAGRIKSTSDFLREYRTALDHEVGELTKLGLQFRAAGKDEATTRNREVISSTSLNPQQLQLQVGGDGSAEPDVSTESYFATRKAKEYQRRGLLPQ